MERHGKWYLIYEILENLKSSHSHVTACTCISNEIIIAITQMLFKYFQSLHNNNTYLMSNIHCKKYEVQYRLNNKM